MHDYYKECYTKAWLFGTHKNKIIIPDNLLDLYKIPYNTKFAIGLGEQNLSAIYFNRHYDKNKNYTFYHMQKQFFTVVINNEKRIYVKAQVLSMSEEEFFLKTCIDANIEIARNFFSLQHEYDSMGKLQ